MDEIRIKAKQYYMEGMKYKDICDKYNISMNTLKSWVKRYNWSDERKSKGKKGAHNNERGAPKEEGKKKEQNKKNNIEYKEEVVKLEDADLTDKQRLFCIYYVRYFNATKAYQKAYKVDRNIALSIAYRLMENDGIKTEIEKLKQHKLNRAMLSEDDIFQKYIDIAFADITDYVDFGTKEVPATTDEGTPILDNNGEQVIYNYSYVDFKDSTEIDGTIISEVSKGKNGIKVKLEDKMKALKWLSDRMNLLPTQIKEKLPGELEEQKARIEKLKADTVKITGATTDIEDLSEVYGDIYGNN